MLPRRGSRYYRLIDIQNNPVRAAQRVNKGKGRGRKKEKKKKKKMYGIDIPEVTLVTNVKRAAFPLRSWTWVSLW